MGSALQITGLYVGLNLLLNLALAYQVSANRVRSSVSTGTGDDDGLYRASRAHTVNSEYTPIGLIGLLMLFALSVPVIVLHVVGLCLTVGRTLHALGLSRTAESSRPRLIGTLLTWIGQLVAGGACIYYAYHATL